MKKTPPMKGANLSTRERSTPEGSSFYREFFDGVIEHGKLGLFEHVPH